MKKEHGIIRTQYILADNTLINVEYDTRDICKVTQEAMEAILEKLDNALAFKQKVNEIFNMADTAEDYKVEMEAFLDNV